MHWDDGFSPIAVPQEVMTTFDAHRFKAHALQGPENLFARQCLKAAHASTQTR
jgi:hypothetical protein